MLTLIVARAKNGAIGRDGDIPWHIPEDLKFFQRETLGGAIIMGRNTWDSLPVKPLSKRLNIVVSRQSDITEHVASSVTEAVEIAAAQGYNRVYGIGGAQIYRDMLPLAHRLLLSEVDIEIDDADTFFPTLDLGDWDLVSERPLTANAPQCVLREYLRRT